MRKPRQVEPLPVQLQKLLEARERQRPVFFFVGLLAQQPQCVSLVRVAWVVRDQMLKHPPPGPGTVSEPKERGILADELATCFELEVLHGAALFAEWKVLRERSNHPESLPRFSRRELDLSCQSAPAGLQDVRHDVGFD